MPSLPRRPTVWRFTSHLGFEAERIVALLLPRTSPMPYVAQIAVLKACGAYTAIDPSFPDDRIADVLEDADAVAVLTDGAGAQRLGPVAGSVPLLLTAELAQQPPPAGAAMPAEVRPDQLAYVIYTSGTTGKPKGVMVEHRNVASLVASDIAEFGLTAADRVIQGSSAAYDSSIEEGAADWVTVSDIYAARTVRALAALGEEAGAAAVNAAQHPAAELVREGKARPALATLVQIAWLAGEIAFGGWVSWAAAWELFPILFDKLDLVAFVLLTPLITVAGVALYLPVSVRFTLVVKWIALGRYRPVRAPVWSTYHLRHWVTVQSARLIPWPMLSGTVFMNSVLRLLGAKIGRGVHIHRGVHLHRGGWDLLEIGDNVTLGQDAHLGVVEYDRGDIVIGRIVIEADATLQTRASVEHDCRVGAGSVFAPLSVLNAGGTIPPGELWDGVPARHPHRHQHGCQRAGNRRRPIALRASEF